MDGQKLVWRVALLGALLLLGWQVLPVGGTDCGYKGRFPTEYGCALPNVPCLGCGGILFPV